jgi:hypothetical protein
MYATWDRWALHRSPRRDESRSLVTIAKELAIAMCTLIGVALTSLLTYLAATRNAAR